MLDLTKLPYPNVIEQLDHERILTDVKTLFKSYLNDDEISLLESDNYSALLETLAYRELLLRARINSSVKATLLPFSEGNDLDNVVSIYGIERQQGEKPSAVVKFSLSTALNYDVYIPQGLVLSNENGVKATLKDGVVIRAGAVNVLGVSLLDSFVKTSTAKCELIQTPLPFMLKAKQESEFTGGAEVENDERLRERAVLSLERFSTAGAAGAYVYHALSANAKVIEAVALNGGAGIVDVFIKSSDMSESVRESVQEYLNSDTRRPITDSVRVKNATKKTVTIKAVVELTDLGLQAHIDNLIKSGETSLNLGQDLNLSYIYSRLHQAGVYRVNLGAPTADVKASQSEFIELKFEISYTGAVL
ncbi:baseplate J/gp47 family protein [Campylobacter sp. RM12920]|uniref:Baseplate J/gp47 family protein n=1 Tax=Campylobacter californiensis TaxID=1032243 RepID=A0ABD4JIS8_9BACT|nr:baseplate J/gp47 family protein [Campylobacter sp. RM12919]MBE2988877.1 baseplate J/gp47 family protein [Campylobacter sp. RM12920]